MATRPYRLEFSLNGLPKNTNSIGRAHWSIKAKEARSWKSQVSWIVKKIGAPKKPLLKAHLTLIRYSSKCPDADGLVSSFKHIIDGLIYAKVLENDSMDHIGMPTYLWEKTGVGHGKVSVLVEEIVK